MNSKIKSLANLIRLKNRRGEKFVLMLGAGASMTSGVIDTAQIIP